jgi:hypothetical protein
MKTFKFEIEGKPDHSAGFLGFNEIVTISVDSGDLGDENCELGFILAMQGALKDWYDTPHVKLMGDGGW